jgi:hypothetical protein
MIKSVLASATLAIFAAPAFAQLTTQPTTPTPPAAEDKFIEHDKDGDGALSVAEVKAADTTGHAGGF